jgi:NitT/TauT family transport system substrate-binding protein
MTRGLLNGVKRSVLVAFGCLALAGLAQAQDDLVEVCFQSKWFPQAQFAGYFVAQELGYYAEEGLSVTVLDGGNVNPTVQVVSGNCDFGTDWIANMLVQRESGLNVVQIAQIYQDSGYRMVALDDSGIETFADMAGRRVGVWGLGNEFVSQAIFAAEGLTSDLDPEVTNADVETVVYAFDPALVFPDEVEVASVMTYNELNQIVGLGFELDGLTVFDPADIDAALLEDLIFTTPELLASEDFKGSGMSGVEVAERFLRATIRGWEYAVANQDEAVFIVVGMCGDTCNGSGSTQSPLIHQTWQMARVAELVAPTEDTMIGAMDQAAFDRSIELLLEVGLISDAVAFEDVVDTSIYEAATGGM